MKNSLVTRTLVLGLIAGGTAWLYTQRPQPVSGLIITNLNAVEYFVGISPKLSGVYQGRVRVGELVSAGKPDKSSPLDEKLDVFVGDRRIASILWKPEAKLDDRFWIYQSDRGSASGHDFEQIEDQLGPVVPDSELPPTLGGTYKAAPTDEGLLVPEDKLSPNLQSSEGTSLGAVSPTQQSTSMFSFIGKLTYHDETPTSYVVRKNVVYEPTVALPRFSELQSGVVVSRWFGRFTLYLWGKKRCEIASDAPGHAAGKCVSPAGTIQFNYHPAG